MPSRAIDEAAIRVDMSGGEAIAGVVAICGREVPCSLRWTSAKLPHCFNVGVYHRYPMMQVVCCEQLLREASSVPILLLYSLSLSLCLSLSLS